MFNSLRNEFDQMTCRIIQGNNVDIIRKLQPKMFDAIITSPPYWGLRDYGDPRQLGLEPTPERFIQKLVLMFRECKRILKDDGLMWVNLGDSYWGSGNGKGDKNTDSKQRTNLGSGKSSVQNKAHEYLKPKDLIGLPWMLAFALQRDGWYLRSDIIWQKPNPMPESVRDRPTKSHEYIFMFSKSEVYSYRAAAIQEPVKEESKKRQLSGWDGDKVRGYAGGDQNNMDKYFGVSPEDVQQFKNKRDVWTVAVSSWRGAHFATYPKKLIEPCVLASSDKGGWIFDPFAGSGTTGIVANEHGRNFIGTELNPEFVEVAKKRYEEENIPLITSKQRETTDDKCIASVSVRGVGESSGGGCDLYKGEVRKKGRGSKKREVLCGGSGREGDLQSEGGHEVL